MRKQVPLVPFLAANAEVAHAILATAGISAARQTEAFRLYGYFDGETFVGIPFVLTDSALRGLAFSDRLFEYTLKKFRKTLRAVRHVGWVGMGVAIDGGRVVVTSVLPDPPSFIMALLTEIDPSRVISGIEFVLKADYTLEVGPSAGGLLSALENKGLIRRHEAWRISPAARTSKSSRPSQSLISKS